MNERILILKSVASKSIFVAVLFGLAFATNSFAATDADPCVANSANRVTVWTPRTLPRFLRPPL